MAGEGFGGGRGKGKGFGGRGRGRGKGKGGGRGRGRGKGELALPSGFYGVAEVYEAEVTLGKEDQSGKIKTKFFDPPAEDLQAGEIVKLKQLASPNYQIIGRGLSGSKVLWKHSGGILVKIMSDGPKILVLRNCIHEYIDFCFRLSHLSSLAEEKRSKKKEEALLNFAKEILKICRYTHLYQMLGWKWGHVMAFLQPGIAKCPLHLQNELKEIAKKEIERRHKEGGPPKEFYGWSFPGGLPDKRILETDNDLFEEAKREIWEECVANADQNFFSHQDLPESFVLSKKTGDVTLRSIFFVLTKFDEYKILLNEKKEFSELKWISPEKFLAGICEDGTYRAFLRFGDGDKWREEFQKIKILQREKESENGKGDKGKEEDKPDDETTEEKLQLLRIVE